MNAVVTKNRRGTAVDISKPSNDFQAISVKLDAIISLLLDLILSDSRFEKSVPYTDKVARLGELGFETNMISQVVRRPSNYVSSRLRESKVRRYSKRRRKLTGSATKSSQARTTEPGKA